MESELFHYDFAAVPCEQRDRLMRLYLDAVRKLNELRHGSFLYAIISAPQSGSHRFL